jgi:hypothetical protein
MQATEWWWTCLTVSQKDKLCIYMIRHSIRFTAKITNMMVVFSVFTQYDAGLFRGFGEACCLHHQGDRTLFRYIHLTQTRRKHSATRYSMYYEVTFWRVRLMFMPPRLFLYHFTRRQRLYGVFMSPATTTLTTTSWKVPNSFVRL